MLQSMRVSIDPNNQTINLQMRASDFDDAREFIGFGFERIAKKLKIWNQSRVNFTRDGNVHRRGESVV